MDFCFQLHWDWLLHMLIMNKTSWKTASTYLGWIRDAIMCSTHQSPVPVEPNLSQEMRNAYEINMNVQAQKWHNPCTSQSCLKSSGSSKQIQILFLRALILKSETAMCIHVSTPVIRWRSCLWTRWRSCLFIST